MKQVSKKILCFAIASLMINSVHASCLSNYQDSIKKHYDSMSFNTSKLASYALKNTKDQMFYNNGKGRSLLGAIAMSTGRVVTSAATGAAIGYALPYVAAGVMVGGATAVTTVICVIGYPFCFNRYTRQNVKLDNTVKIVAEGTSSAVPAVVSTAPYFAAAGAAVMGATSLVFSIRDGIHAANIRQLYLAQSMIKAADENNKIAFYEFYEKLDRKTKKAKDMSVVMNEIKLANLSQTICSQSEPMNFKQIRKALRHNLLDESSFNDDQSLTELSDEGTITVDHDEELEHTALVF